MTKRNPFSAIRTAASDIIFWTGVVVAVATFSAIMVVTIVQGFVEGLPWYETFGFPITIVITMVGVFVLIMLYYCIKNWWTQLEHKWDEENR